MAGRDGIRRRLLAGLGALALVPAMLVMPQPGVAAPKAGSESTKVDSPKGLKTSAPLVGAETAKDAPQTKLSTKAVKTKAPIRTLATSCSGQPDGACHNYAIAYQYVNPGGTTPIESFTMRQEVEDPLVRPWDAAIDGFSLMQNVVQDTVNGDYVEAGWVVQGPFSDDKPRFFVSAWHGGSHVGWGTSFVPVSSPIMSHGTDLSAMVGDGVGFRTQWRYFDNTGCGGCAGWWLYYNKAVGDPLTAIGYYPDSVFGGSGGYTASEVNLVQGFGENACAQLSCQTHMGSGSILNRTATSAYALGGASAPTADWSIAAQGSGTTDTSKWLVTKISSTSWDFGGPGGFDDILGGPAASPTDDCSGEGTGTNPSGLGAVCLYDSWTTPSITPQSKLFQIDMSASTACRTNLGGNGISMIVLTGVKTATVYNTNNCTGSSYVAGHGRVGLAATWSNTAAWSYKVNATYATCATGWPTTAPTC